MGQMLALPGIDLPHTVSEATSIVHLEKDDEDDNRQDGEEHPKHKHCRYKKHYKFCGHKTLKIETIQDLKFGRVVGDSQHSGTVVIHADTGSKTVSRLYDAGGFHSRAEFEIIGKPNKKFIVTLPNKVRLPISTDKRPKIGRFTIFPSSTGRFGPNGKAKVFVGATLKLGPTDRGGEGSGTVPIYVDYIR